MPILSVTWDFDPIFISIGGLEIAYYGLMWLLAFTLGYWIFGKIIKREGLNSEMTGSAFNYALLATIIGARLGHCIFYDFSEYFLDPMMDSFPWLKVLNFRGGGLASHGAAFGLLVGIWLYSRKWKTPYIWFLDRIGIVVAIGGACIRMGNLFNSEIYGTPTDLPWGFIFVRDGQTMPMHPTQIYEAIGYMVIFAVLAHLYWRTKVADRRGVLFGLFLIMLFGLRFLVETIKNVQSPFEQGMTLNMGQWLSIPFVVAGVIILIIALKRKAQPYTNMPLESKVENKKR
ncbi:MAG: prolipoprotein diacylglyceryl transferase [Rikenellaceae bacterium]